MGFKLCHQGSGNSLALTRVVDLYFLARVPPLPHRRGRPMNPVSSRAEVNAAVC